MIKFEKLPNVYNKSKYKYIMAGEYKPIRFNLTNNWIKYICKLDGHGEIPKIISNGEVTIVYMYNIDDYNKMSQNNKYSLRYIENMVETRKTLITKNGIDFFIFTE